MTICRHEGWGTMGYSGEEGPCPEPKEMTPIEGGEECDACGFRYQTLTNSEAATRIFALNRETATLDREVR